MRGLALKIFLSFWLIFVVMIASFAVVPPPEPSPRFVDHVQQNGLVAAALLEQHSAEACDDYLAAVEVQTHLSVALFDAARTPVCRSPGADPEAGGDSETDGILDENTVAHMDIAGPSGKPYTAVGVLQSGFDAARMRAPFPYNLVAIAILVSGIVCFAMARYLARPLRLVRDASYRLAAGDLNARAGPGVGTRNDEIGDLVRDFDAMAGRLEALLHAQSQLLSDMSHELRSPLARLNVALALARRKSGPEAESDLDRVETEADRMNELIGHILALARAESHETQAPTQLVDLADVVRGVTDDAHFEASQQHKVVDLRVATEVRLPADAQLIASAVDNIVRNGVRHTPPGSRVEVLVDRTESHAVIRVRDHGPGVPATEVERIFSPFHRVEPGRNRDTGGVGLGLAIARRAVAVHGGTIAAENANGGGLCVTVRLPLHRSALHP
ncbi:MAG: HAMP domain-containing protein [Acidobacteria bacterium]|nr:HAMP domain-containing protein [Acidobacteriota bacterium]